MLEQQVCQMKALACHLLPFSFPQTSAEDEEIISCLKQREINVDGYDLVVYLNKSKYGTVEMESLQLFGKYFTYLPFSLICKVAAKFLGNKELSLVEVMHYRHNGVVDGNTRKIYVWTVYYENGEPINSPFFTKSTPGSFEGLNFSRVNRDQVVLF